MKGWNEQSVTAALDKLRERNIRVIDTRVKIKKYRNTKTMVNGIKFDSKKEAARYKELLIQLKLGLIGFLELQKVFLLIDANDNEKKCEYKADFVYRDAKTGELIVEDVKSEMTRKLPAYIIKRKLMLKVHNIKIKET